MFNLYKIDVPILDIGNRRGWTDYIDFLKWDEVNYPVMKGTDLFGRSFIVVKMILNNNKQSKIMQTFFQRYSNENKWQACGHATPHLIDTVGGMKKNQFELINKIISGEKVKIDEEHLPSFSLDSNEDIFIELYDEIKYQAILTIQKYWRLCRYNPRYKMCEKVLLNNQKEIEKEYNKVLIN